MRAARLSSAAGNARFGGATAPWRDRAREHYRGVGCAALHQGSGRGRGTPFAPQQESPEGGTEPSGRGRGGTPYAGGAIGRGRGIPYGQQQEAAREGFGRGRGTPTLPAHQGLRKDLGEPPPPRSGGLGRGIVLEGNVQVAEDGTVKAGSGSTSGNEEVSVLNGTEKDLGSPAGDVRKQSAVEKLLSSFSKPEPQVVQHPQFSAPKLSLRMPFARPSPPSEQHPVSAPTPVAQTLKGNVQVAKDGTAKAGGGVTPVNEDVSVVEGSEEVVSSPASGIRKPSAVEKLLFSFSKAEPQVRHPPQNSAPKLPLRMPFARPLAPSEQHPASPPTPVSEPLKGNVEVATDGTVEAAGESTPLKEEDSDVKGTEEDLGLPASDTPKQSALEKLLSNFSKTEPQVLHAPPVSVPKLPLRMPFARPSPPSEQHPVSAPTPVVQTLKESQVQITLPLGAGRGRGQPGLVMQPPIGASAEVVHSPPGRAEWSPQSTEQEPPFRRVDRTPARLKQEPSRPPTPRLSGEEARVRAISILEKAIEKNLAADSESRRKAGMERFAVASEFFTERSNRAPGQSPAEGQRTRKEKERLSPRPRRQKSQEFSMAEPAMETQLTPEQEAKILQIQEEDTFKERLHNLFLVHFEPEYAMEEFGRNPDIDEPPLLSLEEYLQSLKPIYVRDGADLTVEQQWEEAVKTSLANAPNLEKLVEAYAGPGRMTARQQIGKLHAISEKLPPTTSPEVSAFTQRALLTLQNNPGLRFRHKERLMTNIVSGFASG